MKQETMTGEAVEVGNCEQCGRVFERLPTGRPATFCSTACRMRAYRERKRKAAFEARRPVLDGTLYERLAAVDELLTPDETGFNPL